MKTSELFKREIEFIKNEHLRNIVINTLDAAPKCIQNIPASSSGKYHPEYSLGEGGLVRHIKATVGFAYSMIESDVLKGLLDSEKLVSEYNEMSEDVVYASLILHDCCKAKDYDEKHRTQFDHPLIAAKLFTSTAKEYMDTNNIIDKDIKCLKAIIPLIYDAISCHMGKYTTAPYAKGIVLPKPNNSLEWFIHSCDLLSSRKYLEFNFDKYYESIE